MSAQKVVQLLSIMLFSVFLAACEGSHPVPATDNKLPVAAFVIDVNSGLAPVTVNFDASTSSDADGNITIYAWDFGDGSTGLGEQASHEYTNAGSFSAILTVTDENGAETVSLAQVITAIDPNVLPTAEFVVDSATGVNPHIVRFDASASNDPDGTITDYSWDFGDGTTGNTASPLIVHEYTKEDVYLPVLTVTDSDGATTISGTEIFIKVLPSNIPPIAAYVIDVNSGEAALTVNFDARTSVDVDGFITQYTWDFGDGTSAIGQLVSHTYAAPGSYLASVSVLDNNGAQDESATQLINVLVANVAPTAAFVVDVSSGVSPFTVSFSGVASSDSDGIISTYIWDFGDGTTGGGQTTTHTYSAEGRYLASLTVVDDDGLSSTSSITEVIRVLPTNIAPTAAFTVDTNNGEAALTVNFDATTSSDTDGSIVAYNWNFGDGTTGAGQQISHVYATDGNFPATLTVTDDDGEQHTSIAQIIAVAVANVAPTAVFGVDINSGNNPLTVNFNSVGSADSDGSIATYDWDFGDGTTGTGTNASHTYTTAGLFFTFLTVTDDGGLSTISASQTISVFPTNVAPVAAFVVDTASGEVPLAVAFDGSSSTDSDGSIADYSWDFGDGSSGAGQLVSHTYSTVGSYSATLTVTDNQSAQNTSSAQTITVVVANVVPISVFTATPTIGDNPLSVAFNGGGSTDSDGSVVSYAWDFGDGTTASGATANHTYTTVGDFAAVLTITDNSGATNTSASQTISVLPANTAPTSAFTVSTDLGVTPLGVDFDATNSADTDGSIVSYAWEFGDGATGSGLLVSHTYTVAGIYTARLTVTDNEGAQGISTHVISSQVTSGPPTAVLNVDVDSVAINTDVTFDASSSSDVAGGSIVSYAWDFGDGTSGTGVTAVHQYTTTGTYQATLTVTDNDTNTAISAARTITVLAVNAPPTSAFTVDVNSGTSPVTVAFDGATSTDSDGTIFFYEWDFGDGTKGSGAQATHTYFQDGAHSASLTVTDDRGDQNSSSQVITVAANGGFAVTGSIGLVTVNYMDSDINDIAASYVSNNTIASAQLIPSPDSVGGFWGYVTKTATGIAGQRFETSADEVDMYRVTLAKDQSFSINITETTDAGGLAFGNDIDLYLYAVSDTTTPVDSSVNATSTETVTAPVAGDYYVVVSAFSGGSTYSADATLTQSSLATSQSLSLSDEFIKGEVIAKAKEEVISPQGMSVQQLNIHAANQIEALSSRNNISMKRGHASRSSLYRVNAQVIPYAPVSDSLFDGRYGIGLNDADREAYETIKAIKNLRKDSSIKYAEPNFILRPSFVPDDPLYSSQWHYPAINMPATWDITQGSASVIVAVIDTGVFMAHEDLTANLLSTGYDFIISTTVSNDGNGIDSDPDDPGDNAVLSLSTWHGTHVSGTIAASTNNAIGVAGVAPDIRIMPVRALGIGGGVTYDVMQSVLYAAGQANDSGTTPAQAADIINMSIGNISFNQALADAIITANNAGTIIIASAGNDNSSTLSYPASYPGVISVGAVGLGNDKASYSNFGSEIDLVAPGGDNSVDADSDGKLDRTIPSTFVDTTTGSRQSGYAELQGTSMAAPHVAGVVALMKSVYADLTPNLLQALIENGDLTTDLGADGPNVRNDTFGYGMIDALKAVQKAQALAGGATPPAFDEVAITNSVDNMVVSTQQLINITRLTGVRTVASTTVSLPWATLTPSSVDANGMGDYQLTIDRTGLATGVYILDIEFVMDNADVYTTQVTVAEQVAVSGIQGSASAYVVLLDNAIDRNVISQVQLSTTALTAPFTLNNIPNGSYVIFAGTDIDGDRTLENTESYGALGSTGTPSTVTVSGSNVDVGIFNMETAGLSSDVPVVINK